MFYTRTVRLWCLRIHQLAEKPYILLTLVKLRSTKKKTIFGAMQIKLSYLFSNAVVVIFRIVVLLWCDFMNVYVLFICFLALSFRRITLKTVKRLFNMCLCRAKIMLLMSNENSFLRIKFRTDGEVCFLSFQFWKNIYIIEENEWEW